MSVVGSSFITSTNTSKNAVKTLVLRIGKWTFVNTFFLELPHDRADESMPGLIAETPESIVFRDIDKNRTR